MKFTEKEIRIIYSCLKSVFCFGNLNQREKNEKVKPLLDKVKKELFKGEN